MTRFMMKAAMAAVVAGGVAFGGATEAEATTTLRYDINSLTFEGPEDPSTGTGTITISQNASTKLEEIAKQTGLGAPYSNAGFDDSDDLQSVSGWIDIDSGSVTGGNFSFELLSGDAYSAAINGGSSVVDGATGYVISELTFNGQFTDGDNDGAFAGVDASQFFDHTGNGALKGTIGELNYNGGTHNDVNVDGTAVVPSPAAGLAGLPLMGLLGLGYARRRRRQQAA